MRLSSLLLLLSLLWLCAAPGCEDVSATVPHDAAPDADAASADASVDAMAEAAPPDAGPATIRVLFVGNSYTFVNDLPGEVSKLAAAAAGPALQTSSVASGGATLKVHYESSGAVAEIKKASWDVVVLQGQSVEPVYDPTTFGTYAQLLAQEVKQAGAALVFFETWARQAGHEVYNYSWSGGTPKAMQAGLRKAYGSVAAALGGQVAPVGDAWEATLAAYPQLPLFDADGSHPAPQGTYLAACVFYAVLTGHSPKGIVYRPTAVSQTEAAALQQVAHDTVKPLKP
jgi:Domain of unknown function (DUF4886)